MAQQNGDFSIHGQLQRDCHVLGQLEFCHVLLMDNAAVPWFVLVPETSKTELHELSTDEQVSLFDEIKQLSSFVKLNFRVEKMNVAAIGNIVEQMHIHVVGRHPDDYCWPGVVWGTDSGESYSGNDVHQVLNQLHTMLGKTFKPDLRRLGRQ